MVFLAMKGLLSGVSFPTFLPAHQNHKGPPNLANMVTNKTVSYQIKALPSKIKRGKRPQAAEE